MGALWTRGLAIVATCGALLLASSLSGCVVIQQVTATQSGVGPVTVALTICSSGEDGTVPGRPACRELGHSGDPATDPTVNDGASASPIKISQVQVLIGFRIPTAVPAPSRLTIAEAPAVTVLPSTSYAAGLQALKPAPAGQRWVGYLASGPLATQAAEDAGTSPAAFTVRGAFSLPATIFRYRAVVGGRDPNPPGISGGATRPVNCNETAEYGAPGPTLTTACIDSPSPTAGGADSNRSFSVRALAVINGNRFSVKQGATAKPFLQVAATGPPGWGTFALSATSTLSGMATPLSPQTFTPTAAGRISTIVTMKVPQNARLGTYTVTVAAASGAQRRTGSRTFTVTDGTAPRVGLAIARRLDPNGRLAIKVRCPASETTRCKGSLAATSRAKFALGLGRPRTLSFGRSSFNLARGKAKTFRLRPAAGVVAALGTAGKIGAVLKVTSKDSAGNTSTRRVRFTARPIPVSVIR